MIDEVKIWCRAFSAAEILATFVAGEPDTNCPAPPIITQQPQSQTNVVGSNVIFTVVATGAPPLTYQWRFIADVEGGDVELLVGATNSTLAISHVQTNDFGRYDVVIANSFGSVTSAPAILSKTLLATLVLNYAQYSDSPCCWEFGLWQHAGQPGDIDYIDTVVTTPGVTFSSVSGPLPGPGSQPPFILNAAKTSARWYMKSPNGLWNDAEQVTACFDNMPPGGATITFQGYAANGFTDPVRLVQTSTIGANGECSPHSTPLFILGPGNITRYTCGVSEQVCYQASAGGGTAPINIIYNPPSCFTFAVGTTTTVTAIATDASGKMATCTFTVTVLPAPSFWQWFTAGFPDCYAPNFETAYRGSRLNSLPGIPWKNFDDPTPNRRFGCTFNLPLGTYTAGYLYTQMKDSYCAGGPQDDTISLGLPDNSPMWRWSRSLGSFGLPWCNVPLCGPLATLNLHALPSGGGANEVLTLINSSSPQRLDMLVEDDTRVDFAWLRLQRCPPHRILGGLELSLTNAEMAQGPGAWTLVKDTVSTNGFSAKFQLGAADGVRLNFQGLYFSGASNGVLRILGWYPDDEFTPTPVLSLVANTNGTVSLRLGQPLPGVSNVVVQTFSNGVVVASRTLPATPDTELANFPVTQSLQQIAVGKGGEISARMASVWDTDIDVTPQPAQVSSSPLAALTLTALGFQQVTLGQPELRMAPGEPITETHDDWFTSVTGDALAQVDHGQITLSALNATGTNAMGFETILGWPTNEFRATISSSIGLFSPVPSNATLSLRTFIINGGDDDHDRGDREDSNGGPKLELSRGGLGWELTASFSNASLALSHVEVFNNGTNIATFTNPTNVLVAELPSVYWPVTTWFVDADICHRFPYASPVTVWINGAAYETTELRVLTSMGGQPVRAFTGLRVETTGAEALVLSDLEPGPVRYKLEPPVLDGSDIILRGNSLGAVLQSAPAITGPWTTVPVEVGEVRISTTNPPARFFRVRGN